jgi:cysteine desulfurase
MQPVYFDYNATTPLDPDVREAMLPFLGEFYGNPSSVHQVGVKTRALLDDARDRVATVWKAKPSEVVFTSGGTESNNMAVFGTARLLKDKGRHLITSQIEHHAVLNCFEYLEKKEDFEVTYLPVNDVGLISPADLESAIREDTIFVSLMAANNEVGTIQPVAELGAVCQSRGVVFHTDAVQWFGKEPFESIHQFNADLVTCCSHKFHGPKGAGALYIKSPLQPDPILFGGGHENERRAGTENLSAIMGFTKATEDFVRRPVFPAEHLTVLTERLIIFVSHLPLVTMRSSLSNRLSNTISFTVTNTDGMTLMANLDLEGFCASSGSACSAGSLNPSHVLKAMGVNDAEANALVRLSFGRGSTVDEMDRLLACLPEVIDRAQQLE